MALVRPFVAPISAGGLPHTGAIPQSHVSFHVISPIKSTMGSASSNVAQRSAYPSPIIVGQGHLPTSVTPVNFPTSAVPALPVNRGQNYFNHPNS